ncbi:MAG: type II toxin-antitoxin system VapC family toxin [Gemmatimonadota bacterium]
MIFLDSNIPMYLVGAEHLLKYAARRLLERSIAGGDRLVTDVEVIQEILHRYAAIRRRDAIEPCVHALLGVVDEVYPVELDDVLRAQVLVEADSSRSARDALHLAVMERKGVARILSFDRGLDGVKGVERIHE